MKRKLQRNAKYYTLRLFRTNKSDHNITVGFVAGFFHCWFPTFGFGMVISIGLAKLLRGNMVAAVISGMIGSFLWPALFFLNYKIGFLTRHLFVIPVNKLHRVIGHPVPDFSYTETAHHFSVLGRAGLNFLVGSCINSFVFSILGYFIVRFVLGKVRKPIMLRLTRKH
ncbi:DUF2062 domain-containing protein [Gorillibacterium massiliense]|uniref:DUF2062 domain-containing protein n=1 Tax=Gorillibacterium massiliense TaxID=1280390 RepID=UPI0004B01512|nr:DUF2062 domain-containing protein [Gorillibacterium massiliense]